MSGQNLAAEPRQRSTDGIIVDFDAAKARHRDHRLARTEEKSAQVLSEFRAGRASFSDLISALIEPFHRERRGGA